MRNIKRLFTIHILTWFILLSGLLLIFWTPSLSMRVVLNEPAEGTVVSGNYNTDHGEELFYTYNYTGHKTWAFLTKQMHSVSFYEIPLVTNQLEFKDEKIDSLDIKKIQVMLGPFVLKEYNAFNIKDQADTIQNLDISVKGNHINIDLEEPNGYIRFKENRYVPYVSIILLYISACAVIYGFVVWIDRHSSVMERIPDDEAMLLGGPCWIFFLSECILGNYFYTAPWFRLLNAGILIILNKLIWRLCRRHAFGFDLCNVICIVYAIISTYVVSYRNRPIAPWDFSAIATAMDVAGSYDLKLNAIMIFSLCMCIFFGIVMHFVKRDLVKQKLYLRIYGIIVIVLAIFFCSVGQYFIFDVELLSTFQNEGTALTFTGLTLQYLREQPHKPSGYSEETLLSIEKDMKKDAEKDAREGTVPTHIIMIMNESFSDLDIGGTDYADGAMDYFLSLDNTIRGNLYVSVRGGGTCNTEYETLTGNTTALFASGVYPYSMYMNRDVPSLVSVMNEEGYLTTGMHLGKASNWNRKTAYERLQFDQTVFAETFDGLQTIHGFPGDEADYQKLEEVINEHEDQKQFLFNVTYQNHGGYDDSDDLKKTFDLSKYGSGDYDLAENYLSLIQISDHAFQDLIEYYSKSDEPVMIIMYGDHQPAIGADADNLFFPNAGNGKENLKEYVTPFAIWANYDIPDENVGNLSANYMSALVMHAANMELTPYQQFLWELKDKYPVITLNGCLDKNGKYYASIQDIDDEKINEYKMLQYNNVFDKNRIDSLFSADD